MRTSYFLFLFCWLLVGCGPADSDLEAERAAWAQVQLNCEAVHGEGELPRYAVYAMLEENKIKLAEMGACDTVIAIDYATHGIPADAITAVGSEVDGYEEYIYARINEDKLQLFIGGTTEEGEHDKPLYSPLADYEKGRFKLLRPLHQADLAGYYMSQGPDTSYVLFLGLKGPSLVGKLFATTEAMPAQKVLQRALPEFAASPDMDFNCNLNGLNFESGLGDGHIYWQPDSASVTFHQFMGHTETKVFELMLY
jgi:hypothetical protein